MKDSISNGNGNSRYMKSSIPADATWADVLALLRGGTFPFDLNGINNSGFSQVGTPLNKASLLSDTVATLLGLGENATPNDALNALCAQKVNADQGASNYGKVLIVGSDGRVTLKDAGIVHHYTVRWNKTTAAMTRLNDAAHITTTTTNFGHFGSKNTGKANPFDNVYPWSGRKLCNIDIDRYYALAAGADLLACVKAWEGDADFSYTDADGVWVYTPEFWGKAWEDGTYRYFDVTDVDIGGYVHYKAGFTGRWHGRKITRTVNGASKDCLIPTPGIPAVSIAMSTLHTYAKNYKATLDNIFSIDASRLLCIVEYANMNTQAKIGNGVSDLYRQSGYKFAAGSTASAVVKVVAAEGTNYCIPGAIMDIGTSDGGAQVGSYQIVSVAADGANLSVTLNEAVTVTTANFWSIHGLANAADSDIGSDSGYIGTNGKCNAYYRGEVMYGNMWFYILGAYRQQNTEHIWIAHDENEADDYDTLDTAVHFDTGLNMGSASGYVKTLGMLERSGLLTVPPFCTENGGDSSNPVGDYFYKPTAETVNTVLICGGDAGYGASAGAFCGAWGSPASHANWSYAARPRLKTP